MIDKQTNTTMTTEIKTSTGAPLAAFNVKPSTPVENKRNAMQISNINFTLNHQNGKYYRFYDVLGVVTYERNNRPCAQFYWRDRKNPESFYYRSEEERAERIGDRIKAAKAYATRIAERKNRKNDLPEINVGDVLVTSWGYEQTNVNFYQVIERKGKTKVTLREVASKTLEETSWCSANVTPVKDAFISGQNFLEKRISRYGVKMHSSATARKTDWDSSHHRSWGY